MSNGALIGEMVSQYHLRGGKMKGRVNGQNYYENGEGMLMTTPLENVVSTQKKGGSGKP